MKSAFETLGLPTWHWVTMAENPVRKIYEKHSLLRLILFAFAMQRSEGSPSFANK